MKQVMLMRRLTVLSLPFPLVSIPRWNVIKNTLLLNITLSIKLFISHKSNICQKSQNLHKGSLLAMLANILSCRIFSHLATLLHLAMLQSLRALTLAPPTPFSLWPLVHKKSRSLSGLPPLLIYHDIHWCLHQRTVYILYVLQISRV